MVLKKLAVGLACVGMVLFSTVPVHAANDADTQCRHSIYGYYGETITKLTGEYNEGTHKVVVMEVWECLICGHIRAEEVSRREEPHSPHFTSLSSGHTTPKEHGFRGTCVCGFTTTAMMYCSGC